MSDYEERLDFIRWSWWFILMVFIIGLITGYLIKFLLG